MAMIQVLPLVSDAIAAQQTISNDDEGISNDHASNRKSSLSTVSIIGITTASGVIGIVVISIAIVMLLKRHVSNNNKKDLPPGQPTAIIDGSNSHELANASAVNVNVGGTETLAMDAATNSNIMIERNTGDRNSPIEIPTSSAASMLRDECISSTSPRGRDVDSTRAIV